MSHPPTYKPSPLSFGSPRTSPFQRPSSPLSPSSTIHPPTPTKPHTPIPAPSKLQTVRPAPPALTDRTRLASGTTTQAPRGGSTTTSTGTTRVGNADALAQLPPAQAREMREAFQVLDRDGDGLVTREDVADLLTNLGQDATPATLHAFFPHPTTPAQTLPHFLSQLSALLAPLSSRTELLNAFAAFDDDDSGQVDLGELRDALLHTGSAPEWGPGGRGGERGMGEREVDGVLDGFRGKRAFEKRTGLGNVGRGKGEVFRYGEFVGVVVGSGEGKEGEGVE